MHEGEYNDLSTNYSDIRQSYSLFLHIFAKHKCYFDKNHLVYSPSNNA